MPATAEIRTALRYLRRAYDDLCRVPASLHPLDDESHEIAMQVRQLRRRLLKEVAKPKDYDGDPAVYRQGL